MKKNITKIFALGLTLLVFCSNSTAEDTSLLPMYGGIKKTAEQQKTDEEFIASVIKISGSAEKAARQLVEKGFTALGHGDADQAMRRFNQAYLLTPNENEVLWGLAAASAAKGLFNESFGLFDRLSKSDPQNVRLINDFAYARINNALSIPDRIPAFEQLKRAEDLLAHAQKIDPEFDRTYFNLATIHYYRREYASAWDNVKQCEKFGGKSLDPRFVSDLTKVMPRPN